jgi:hypothetical protein
MDLRSPIWPSSVTKHHARETLQLFIRQFLEEAFSETELPVFYVLGHCLSRVGYLQRRLAPVLRAKEFLGVPIPTSKNAS